MKKLLTMTLALIALAAFTGLSAAQEKKPVEPAAIPPEDMVTLAATQNVVSKTGCPVTARPGFSGNPSYIYPNYHSVNFEKWVSNTWVALQPNPSMVTNPQGVASRTVPWNTKIRAWITKVNGQKAYSGEFTCGKQYPTE